jgi:hypothetical protein
VRREEQVYTQDVPLCDNLERKARCGKGRSGWEGLEFKCNQGKEELRLQVNKENDGDCAGGSRRQQGKFCVLSPTENPASDRTATVLDFFLFSSV